MSTPWETYRAGNTVRLRRRPVRYHAGDAPAKSVPETHTADLGSLLKAELIEKADELGIDSSGTKADIIERLTDE